MKWGERRLTEEEMQTPNLKRRPENSQGVIYAIHISKIVRIAL
jgi:hypothetical protein